MFERLTARSPKNSMAYLINVKQNEQDVESPYPNTLRCIMDSFNRLASYEDSGLSPEEVQELKVSVKICEDCWNHAQAKADGRLVVLLPIDTEVYIVQDGEILTFRIYEFSLLSVNNQNVRYWAECISDENEDCLDFWADEIGKVVFLTEMEAKEVLKCQR